LTPSQYTGKFFNLRRFTKSRFDEPNEGGGQLPYWFEQGLMAFLREADLSWFSRLEAELDSGESIPKTVALLTAADKSWSIIDNNKIYFEERKNKGEWVRAWLQAIDYFVGDK
jgi:hypothetical protein